MGKIICGDALQVLKTFSENSVDSVCCDPPYELGFMGKSWDNTGIANNVDFWKQCLRVLKPGGHLLSFGGTRTYHRMACAIEDAGFEVRDMVEWVYGSGMSKCNVWGKGKVRTSKSLNAENDLMVENGWEGWGKGGLKPSHEPICMARKPLAEKTVAENVLKYGTGGINIDESRVESMPRKTGTKPTSDEATGSGSSLQGSSKNRQAEYDEQNLGRFPANLITDGSEEVRECFPETNKSRSGGSRGNGEAFFGNRSGYERGGIDDNGGNASRYFKSILYYPKASKSERNKGCEELYWLNGKQIEKELWEKLNQENETNKDNKDFKRHSISRTNIHPTVKNVSLMSYLIKMVTPKGGIVLDPFSGSGSTLVAAKENGFDFIGIEKEPEYIKIIEARTGIKAEVFDKEIKEVAEVKQEKVEVKSGLSKCCNAKIIKGYCEKCCELVK